MKKAWMLRVFAYAAVVTILCGSVMADCTTWAIVGSNITIPIDCNVGIGTTTPAAKLEVREGPLLLTSATVSHGMTQILPDKAFLQIAIDTNYSGGVGLIGATANANGVPFNFQGVLGTTTPGPEHAAIWFHAYKKNGTGWQALGAGEAAFRFRSAVNDLMIVMGSGNIGIGNIAPEEKLHVTGNAKVSGNVTVGGNLTAAGVIGALYEDLAEWVPATENLDAGTVVVLNPNRDNEVMASSVAYDSTVAGVVSEQPGVILGVAGAAKEQVATTGRVRVKVSAAGGAIRIGDLLVTSDKPGVAMKSQPVDVGNGIRMHRPGTIVGKALQGLPAGEGQILVLLSLQ